MTTQTQSLVSAYLNGGFTNLSHSILFLSMRSKNYSVLLILNGEGQIVSTVDIPNMDVLRRTIFSNLLSNKYTQPGDTVLVSGKYLPNSMIRNMATIANVTMVRYSYGMPTAPGYLTDVHYFINSRVEHADLQRAVDMYNNLVTRKIASLKTMDLETQSRPQQQQD